MNPKFILFAVIISAVYLLANSYVLARTWQALSAIPHVRIIVFCIFTFSALSFLAGMFLESLLPFWANWTLQNIAFVWLGGLLFGLLSCLVFDLVRLANYLFPFFPKSISENYGVAKAFVFAGVFFCISLILLIGNLHFRKPAVVKLDIKTQKEHSISKPVKILMFSDLHMGYVIGKSMIQKYVNQINELQPDLVLCAGDLFDRSLKPVKSKHLLEALNAIHAPLGFYAVPGNHDFMGGIAEISDYIATRSQIKFLRDTVVNINNEFLLIGRDDKTNSRRKPLAELVKSADKNLPIVLLDHQPYHLGESEKQNIDLHLSGHTHNGQLWPFNYIIEKMYEVGYGYKQKGNTHIYVSSGLGIWGPPFRIGTQSEMVLITLH